MFFLCNFCYAADDTEGAQEAARDIATQEVVEEVPQEDAVQENFFWEGLARAAPWGRPFWADMHSTLIRAEAAYATNSPEYNYADLPGDYRPYAFINLGADIPVWSGDFSGDQFGLKITFPIMFDVWLDLFERTTAPVINTDYRFGVFETNFMYRFEKPIEVFKSKWNNMAGDFLNLSLRNVSFRFTPFKHESTHIGDELTISRKDLNMDITRVNVSYNYAEFQLVVNDPENSRESNHALKIGLLLLHHFDDGWYSILPAEGNVESVEPSQSPVEMYFQYQYQTTVLHRGFQGIISAELRMRERYHYPYQYQDGHYQEIMDEYYRDIPFTGRWSFNLAAGIRYFNPRSNNYFSKIGLMFHYYTGINPYGQFRSMPRYNQFGLALVFE
jgi:hypothetical protein